MYRTLLASSLVLYSVATITSMAAMEIFSWLTFTIVLAGLIAKVRSSEQFDSLKVHKVGADLFIWGLFVTVVLGVVINGSPGIDWLHSIGSMRWVLLLYVVLAALMYLGTISEKALYIFNTAATIVALHSILMHFTGYSYVRGEAARYATGESFRGAGFLACPPPMHTLPQ